MLAKWFNQNDQAALIPGRFGDPMSTTPIAIPAVRTRRRRGRGGVSLPFDAVLFLAVAGLCARRC